MAEHICWGELVGELTHILARAKRMKKHQRNVDVWWEVDELSKPEKDYYLDPNNEGFKNFIHDKSYTNKADLYRIRFFGPKIKTDAKLKERAVPKLTASQETFHKGIHGNPAFSVENVAKKLNEALVTRARTWDVTQEEAQNRARIPTKEEQRDVRENGMLGNGTRDHIVIYTYYAKDGGVTTSENVTFTEALHLARNAKDCVAHVVKLIQTVDNRKTPLERAQERVSMVLQNIDLDRPRDGDMIDLHAALEAWKKVKETAGK